MLLPSATGKLVRAPDQIMSLVMLQMLKRNMSVKAAPERWHGNEEAFDVVITFEERLLDSLLEGELHLMHHLMLRVEDTIMNSWIDHGG